MYPQALNLPGLPVSHPQFWRQPVRVDASPDPNTATAQTVQIMAGHIQKAAQDPAIEWVASEALARFGGLAFGSDDQRSRIAESAWWWSKSNIRFVHHESLLRRYLGESGHLQGLISPDVLIRMEWPEGDCAIFTEMIAALLRVGRVPYELVTVAVNPREPKEFTHVYPRAVLSDGRRLVLDASHGDYPGWQVPSSDIFRLQVWDENGNPIADRGSRFDGLHNYVLRGLGDPCNVNDPDYDPMRCDMAPPPATPSLSPGGTTSTDLLPYFHEIGLTPVAVPMGSGTVATGYAAPSQSSAAWAPFASQLVRLGFTQLAINSIQPGTVVGRDGSILRQNPGYSVPVGPPTIASSFGGSSSMLMIGGLVIGGVVLMSMMRGK